MDATLGVVQRVIEGGRDGWELALDELASDPDGIPARLRELGAVIGRMHAVLGSEPPTPRSPPRSPAPRGCRCSRRRSTSRSSARSSTCRATTRRSRRSPVAARRSATACGCCRTWARAAGSSATTATCTSGQTLLADAGWIILDFEGDPRARCASAAASAAARRRRDAALLRLRRLGGRAATRRHGARRLGGAQPRGVPGATSPPSSRRCCRRAAPATEQLLSIFELEKAVYELRYELDNRPDWVHIPVAGIAASSRSPP